MIITPDSRVTIDGQPVDVVSILDEAGIQLADVVYCDTKTGTVIHYARGVDGKFITTPDGREIFTRTSHHKQLFFAITAGPSEEVLREVVEMSPVGNEGEHKC